MRDYVDLHCHFLPEVDDGARSLDDAHLMLQGLWGLGFGEVVATPHMRPGLFDNVAANLREAFERVERSLHTGHAYPSISLGAEHYFDDVVFSRILSDQALPFPPGKAILLEFYNSDFPFSIDLRLADIWRKGMTPVIAHPERYKPIEKQPEILERLLDLGAVALLDIGALVGKYGRHAARTAEELLERGLYAAACSDAHSPKDLPEVARGIEWVRHHYGDDEVTELLATGPRALLAGPKQR
jgi:protein-tyrosine phosphatase